MVGETLSHYHIQETIGQGGMGVVYKALDTRLQRAVAIKVLRNEAVNDPERIRRFVQEARAASALHHPNIVTVYDVDTAGGIDFIAMEYVAGKPLDEILARGRLPLADTLRYAIQTANALATAHESGIVHRDLKPGNIMVSPRGEIKLLDFGLAKLVEPLITDQTATVTRRSHTQEGTIVGTVAYMSPEQAEGKRVDARSDIFSFGAVLYEMATGQRAFTGDTPISTLAAILHHDPAPATELAQATPPELDRIIGRCLRKDPTRRIQHMDDVKLALEELVEETQRRSGAAVAPTTASTRRMSPRLRVATTGALLLVVAAVGAMLWLWRTSGAALRAPASGAVLTPITADSGLSCDPALSPDGKLLAYASDRSGDGNFDIWVQQVGGRESVRVTRHAADDYEPSFSPDGTLIAFASQRQGPQAGIYVVPALSGEERKIVERGRRPRFSPDGAWIAYWDANAVYVVPSAGGTPKRIAPQFLEASYPSWFADSRRLMFVGNRDAPGRYVTDWYVAPIDGGPIAEMGAQGLIDTHRLRGPYGLALIGIVPELSPAGNTVLFFATAQASANLWRMRISGDTGRLSGTPEQLTFLATDAGLGLQPSAVLSGGVLRVAFWNVTANLDIWGLTVDAARGRTSGPMRRLTRSTDVEQWGSLSGDGGRMAYNVRKGLNWDVWVMDLESGRQTPLAVGPLPELWPKVSRDGGKVAYAVEDGKGGQEIHIRTLGATVSQKACVGCTEPWDWSSNGEQLLYRTGVPRKIGVISATARESIVLEHPQYSLHAPKLSPDDRWVVFSAQPEGAGTHSILFLAPFRGTVAVAPSEWRVISDGQEVNNAPTGWSPDGSMVYFMSERDGFRCLWAQRLHPTTKDRVGAPFEVQPFHQANVRSMPLWQPGAAGTALGGRTITFSMAQASGNIWLAQVK